MPAFGGVIPGQRQYVADGIVQAAFQVRGQGAPLNRVGQVHRQRIEVDGDFAFFQRPVQRVFVTRRERVGVHGQVLHEFVRELFGVFVGEAVVGFLGDEVVVLPNCLTVGAPVERVLPAWKRLAGVPFSLPELQQPAVGKAFFQAQSQVVGKLALQRPVGHRIPLVGLEVIDGNESRLAAHRHADIMVLQVVLDCVSHFHHLLPLRLGVGLGDARVFVDAENLVLEIKCHLAGVHRARDGGRAAVMRRAAKRNVALARK